MNSSKKNHLEKNGWSVGDAADFLGLSPHEEALVETGALLSRMVREKRLALGLKQADLAEKLGTKQPNIARLETAGGTSFDRQFEALYAMGVSPREIGEALAAADLEKHVEEHVHEFAV